MKRLLFIFCLISSFCFAQETPPTNPVVSMGTTQFYLKPLSGDSALYIKTLLGWMRVRRYSEGGGGGGSVTSVFGRTGAIVAGHDYDAFYYPLTGNPSAFLTTELDPTVPTYAKSLTAFSVIQSSTDPLYRPITYVPTFASITSKPTTLSGYGITDAYPISGNPSSFLTTNQTITFTPTGDVTGTTTGTTSLTPVFTIGAGRVTNSMIANGAVANLSGTNTGDNAVNSLYSGLVTMTYPGAGIALSTGSAWGTSITNNSGNWNTAFSQTRQWDGGSTGLVAATGRTSLGLGTLATQSGTFSGTSSGTNTGDQTITLTGNVTGSGTGSFATTIAASAVTNAMLAGSIDLTSKVTGLLPDGNISSAATWNAKQAALASGTNLKTINSNSLLGSGNVAVGDALVANPLSQFATTTSAQLATVVSDESGTGVVAYTISPVFTTPNIGSATGSISGNAGTVTTNANLTGDITSSGNTTTYNNIVGSTKGGSGINNAGTLTWGSGGTLGTAAYTAASAYEVPITFSTGLTRTTNTVTVNTSQNIATLSNLTSNGIVTTSGGTGALSVTANTGSGNVVLATSPTLVTPALGTPTALVGTSITGTAAGLTAGNVTTNANLTGEVTSVGNAATINTTAAAGNHIATALNAGTGLINVANIQTSTHGGYTNGPTVNEGLIANGGQYAYSFTSSNTQGMSRSSHFATQDIKALKILVANSYINGSFAETGTGTSETITASVEYPSGTYTRINWVGTTTGTILNNSTLLSDYTTISIPANAQFWIRLYVLNSGGITYVSALNTSSLGTGGNFGTSGIADLTMTTGSGIGAGNNYIPTMGIIGYTSNASVVTFGDSKANGNNDLTTNSHGNFGTITKSLDLNYGNSCYGIPGDFLSNFLTSNTNRIKILPYVTHIINAYNFNDTWGAGASSVTMLANDLTLQNIGHQLNKKVYNVTIGPKTTSTDSWATTGNQTIASAGINTTRVTYNTAIRAGGNGQDGYFDIANPVESSLNSGKWAVTGFTTDGIHESTKADTTIASAGVVPYNLFKLGQSIFGYPAIAAGVGAGTSPTASVSGNGKQLTVTVTTGTLPTGTNSVVATITLPFALNYTPSPVFSPGSAATSLLSGASMVYMTSTGPANVTITSGTTALTAATTYVWSIIL